MMESDTERDIEEVIPARAAYAGEHVRRNVILDALLEAPAPMSVQMLAEQVGLHVTTVRFHLAKLISSGAVNVVPGSSSGRGRPPAHYEAAPRSRLFTFLPLLLDQFGSTEAAREQLAANAGRIWARNHSAHILQIDVPDPASVALEILGQLGFRVSTVTSIFGEHELKICSCPLREIALTHPEIASGIQRGAIEEALALTSPALASQYSVSIVPDALNGECEVMVRLVPASRNGGGGAGPHRQNIR
jgi:predicted ArsR family transcriptional regulator